MNTTNTYPYGAEGVRMQNPQTGTTVITTGEHWDKSNGYQFLAHRLVNGEISETPELFQKMAFEMC